MQIPDFQPTPPPQSANEPATPFGPRRTNVSGIVEGESGVRPTETSPSIRIDPAQPRVPPPPAGDPVDALDTVEISTLSQAVLQTPEVDARVERLEQVYAAGSYRVDPNDLARTLVQTYLAAERIPQGRRENPDQPASSVPRDRIPS